MKKLLIKGMIAKDNMATKIRETIKSKKGEGYIDTGVKGLMAIVIGALILAGLYSLFSNVILPSIQEKVIQMFNYKG